MLASKEIDLEHNRFLILQGEVEQISLMKPIATNPNETGLLEYLEEIIGSNKYHSKIEETQKLLETHTDQRIEKINRVRAAEIELSSMNPEKEVAVGFLKSEREFMRVTNLLLFIEMGSIVSKYNQCIESIV